MKVPHGAREVLGKTELWQTLGTEDLATARARAVVEGGRMREQIEAARRNSDGTRKDVKGDPTEDQKKLEAWWVERRVPVPGTSGQYTIPDELEAQWDATVEAVLGEPTNAPGEGPEEEYEPARNAAALRLVGRVTGTVVPVTDELDRYLKQQGVKASYAARTRSAVKALEAWLVANEYGDNIHAVTGTVADKFADSLAEGRTTKTQNTLVSALSAYWGWMRSRHIVTLNPWAGLSRREVDRSRNAEKRPFTNDEIKALLSGPAKATLRDMMLLAALTGMRQAEIGNLRVRDAEGGVFVVTKSKTTAGERVVPIHPDLTSLVARRAEGKAADAYLLEELTAPASRPARRGYKVAEWFTAYPEELEGHTLESEQPNDEEVIVDIRAYLAQGHGHVGLDKMIKALAHTGDVSRAQPPRRSGRCTAPGKTHSPSVDSVGASASTGRFGDDGCSTLGGFAAFGLKLAKPAVSFMISAQRFGL